MFDMQQENKRLKDKEAKNPGSQGTIKNLQLKSEAAVIFDHLETLCELIHHMASYAGLNHYKDPKEIELMKKKEEGYKQGKSLKEADLKIKQATEIVQICTRYLQM